MENASKALLMAGGILIAIITLTLLVYMFTISSRLAVTQDAKTLAEQTTAFNKEYEAYDKSRMYGTDIISVVNKAIDYNKRLDTNEEEYKINIVLVLNEDFNRTKQTITQNADGTKDYSDLEPIEYGTLKTGTYQLFERENSTKMNDDIISFFGQSSSDNKTDIHRGTKIITTYEYSAISNFKRAIFKCVDVSYSKITGRVSSMTFTQI